MATSFQPEKPHDPSKHSSGRSSYVILAIVSALLVMMLIALAAPQLSGESGTNWLLTIGGGVLVFAGILAYGTIKGRGNQGTAE
jgi:hypothetical protein